MSKILADQLCLARTVDAGHQHQCYLFRDHAGPHRCSCSTEWEAPEAGVEPQATLWAPAQVCCLG
jgi:hypothetical protein